MTLTRPQRAALKLPTERWADMFLAWVLDHLTDDPKGQALLGWITNHLLERIKGAQHAVS